MMSEALVEGTDYYMEDGFMVFTATYLRRRGYCCESGCRHCPYGFVRETERRRDIMTATRGVAGKAASHVDKCSKPRTSSWAKLSRPAKRDGIDTRQTFLSASLPTRRPEGLGCRLLTHQGPSPEFVTASLAAAESARPTRAG